MCIQSMEIIKKKSFDGNTGIGQFLFLDGLHLYYTMRGF